MRSFLGFFLKVCLLHKNTVFISKLQGRNCARDRIKVSGCEDTCRSVWSHVWISDVSNLKFPKGDWGNEMWSLGLLPTGGETLAEVGRPFGCAVFKFVVK